MEFDNTVEKENLELVIRICKEYLLEKLVIIHPLKQQNLHQKNKTYFTSVYSKEDSEIQREITST